MNNDDPFELSYPEAELEPTKFSINEESRNFPKEAIERLDSQDEASEKTDESSKSSRKKRHIPGKSIK